MMPGAVAIWPDRAGEIDVAPIERLSWSRRTLTIVLRGGRRIVVNVTPETLAELVAHQDEMRFLRFRQSPGLILG